MGWSSAAQPGAAGSPWPAGGGRGGRGAVAAASGPAALPLALLAHGVGPGDEVITTPLTFQATANMVLAVGARPVFVDVGEDGNIDPALVEAAITPRTKALLPVHLYGRLCGMTALSAVAESHGLVIIEDAAQAHGASLGGPLTGSGRSRRAGSFGAAAAGAAAPAGADGAAATQRRVPLGAAARRHPAASAGGTRGPRLASIHGARGRGARRAARLATRARHRGRRLLPEDAAGAAPLPQARLRRGRVPRGEAAGAGGALAAGAPAPGRGRPGSHRRGSERLGRVTAPERGEAAVRELAVGVVGLGFGANHARVLSEMAGVRLAAVCDTDAKRLAAVAGARGARGYADYEAMLCQERLDALVIAAPARLHEAVALAAIEAGGGGVRAGAAGAAAGAGA